MFNINDIKCEKETDYNILFGSSDIVIDNDSKNCEINVVFGSASISISHTKGYVAVLLGGPEKEVGIDVECYGERVRKVAHKFVREDESVSWYKGTETWSLLLHWSAKETMFKCMNTLFSNEIL